VNRFVVRVLALLLLSGRNCGDALRDGIDTPVVTSCFVCAMLPMER
jgi:hypothetical protein